MTKKNDGLNQKVMSDFMISVENTIRLIKENIPQREIEFVDLMDSLKRVLAEEIISPANSPSVNNSAMDGFAVRWHDLEKSSDETLRFSIIGESRAGYPFNGKMTADSAIRISTGAVVPLDADCVIPIEKCRVENNYIETQKNHKKNQHIRFAGEEFKKGQKLLDCGTQIGSAQIALLASLGFSSIKVYKKPLVSIITTGSELIPFSEKAEIYQLHDSNTPMLISAIAEAGGSVAKTFHAEDDFEQTKKVIEYATKKSQVIITSGGVSVGIHDHVRDAALELGFTELFWKVNQKPGKPMFMGKKDSLLLFALPGNPVSAFMCFKHYVRPLLQNIFGLPFDWPVIKASAKTEIKNKSNRKQFIRIRLLEVDGEKIVEPLHLQGSHMPSSIAHADGYLMLFEGQEIKANTITTVYLF